MKNLVIARLELLSETYQAQEIVHKALTYILITPVIVHYMK